MNFSMIVPTRYRSKMLQYFLDSLKRNSVYEHELIIICDIFTSWQTYKLLQERNLFYYQVDYCNWYKMLNFGADQAKHEYLALCQDDVLFGYHWDLNIEKYLNPMAMLAPTFLEHVSGLYFGSKERADGGRYLEDFNFDEYEIYCKTHNDDGFGGDVKHPMIVHRETFSRLGKFTYFTGEDGVHYHHDGGFRFRLQLAGGNSFNVKNSFVYHVPNTGYDENIPRYNYILYYQKGHTPVECYRCHIKIPGKEFSRQELDNIINIGYWLCQKCR